MTADPLEILAKLQQQALRFEAGQRIDALHNQVHALLVTSPDRHNLVQAITGLDVGALSPEALDEATALAARVGLQVAVDSGRLTLFVNWPNSGRFFALPKDALVSAFKFQTSLGGQSLKVRAQHVPMSAWTEGHLVEADCDPALAALAKLRLPIYVTDKDADAALRAIRQPSLPASLNADSDDAVDATIRRLVAENGGKLPLNDGAKAVIDLHPSRKRDEIRRRITAIATPGGRGRPRKYAAS